MRRKIFYACLVLLLAAGGFLWWWSRPLPVLTVTTWAGTYGRAQAAAQIQPYGAEKRVNARIAQWADNGTIAELRRAIASGQAGDVMDLELPVAVQACYENLLEPIDAASLPPGADGTPAAQDFYKGMVGRCFVASAIYGQMLVCKKPCGSYNLGGLFFALASPPRQPGEDAPALMGGKIALQRGAKINLEMALLADGALPGEIYDLLATPAGVNRAFAKLDTIRHNIIWWTNPADPIRMLRSGEVQIATALTAEVQAATSQGDIAMQRGQFYEADVLAIPRGTPRKEMALDYLHYATGSAPLAGMTRFAPYLPPRRSALALVQQLPPSPTRDFVLSHRALMADAFAIDDAWWRVHGEALESRFRSWAAG
jgi:putative spermidine/putrescine transport system substrate-binding protein